MQKVEGSSPFSRSFRKPRFAGAFAFLGARLLCASERWLPQSATTWRRGLPRNAGPVCRGRIGDWRPNLGHCLATAARRLNERGRLVIELRTAAHTDRRHDVERGRGLARDAEVHGRRLGAPRPHPEPQARQAPLLSPLGGRAVARPIRRCRSLNLLSSVGRPRRARKPLVLARTRSLPGRHPGTRGCSVRAAAGRLSEWRVAATAIMRDSDSAPAGCAAAWMRKDSIGLAPRGGCRPSSTAGIRSGLALPPLVVDQDQAPRRKRPYGPAETVVSEGPPQECQGRLKTGPLLPVENWSTQIG